MMVQHHTTSADVAAIRHLFQQFLAARRELPVQLHPQADGHRRVHYLEPLHYPVSVNLIAAPPGP